MMNISVEQFDFPNYNPNRYVKEISHGCVGGIELQQQRVKIQNLANETSNLLKKNVYRNYTLFIETAKEISRLEGDMYQLSHLLSEQRSLLTTLATSSIFEDQQRIRLSESDNKDEEEVIDMKRRKALSDVAEKIEGCINLTENSGRQYLYEGDLIELDAIDNSQICKLRAYLLSDVLLLASTIINRRSPARYKLETVYDVNNLAIVNVKDVKNALKLLAFPDTRVFQAINSQAKKEWLDKFEEAKKLLISSHNRKRGSITVEQKSPARTVLVESFNYRFDDVEDCVGILETVPDWLLEVAEDLDVLIVERHFEDAYSLIEKTRTHLKENPPSNEILLQDIQGKVDVRIKTLAQILTKELEVTPEKSHQGGLRAARRSVKLLNTLQKSTQACDLFLKLCSNILRSQLMTVKGETTRASYVKQLSVVFFSNLCDMAKEFQCQAFPNNPSCASSFVVWCMKEVSNFVSRLIRQVFLSQISLAILHKCVEYLHLYAKQLLEFGIDVIYLIDGQLRTPLTRILFDTRDKLAESVNAKIAEEKWLLTNMKSKQQVEKLVTEFGNLGIFGTEKYIQDVHYFQLTNNCIWFCRIFIQFVENSAFDIASIEYDVEQAICDILLRFIEPIIQALYNDRFKNEKPIIELNGKFLAEEFILFCETLFQKRHKSCSIKLRQIRNEFNESLNENSIS